MAVIVSIVVFFLTSFALAGRRRNTWSDSAIVSGLLCIHRYEGSWNDSGAPYYGGLQMDWNFMRHYGAKFLRRWGHAGNWPVWAQLQAGVRGARDARGFNPWPNTRKMCGLPYYF